MVSADDVRTTIYDLLSKGNNDILHDFYRKLEINDFRNFDASTVGNDSIARWMVPLFIYGRKALPGIEFRLLDKAVYIALRVRKRRDSRKNILPIEIRRETLAEYSADNKNLCIECGLCDEKEIDYWLGIND